MIFNPGNLYKPSQCTNEFSTNKSLYREYKPSIMLSPYIYCYWVTPAESVPVELLAAASKPELIIPDGCIDIIFRYDKVDNKEDIFIVGIMDKPDYVYLQYDRVDTFAIRFYPGAIYPLIRNPVNTFVNDIVSLKSDMNPVFIELGKRVFEAKSTKEKIQYAEEFLASMLYESHQNNSVNRLLYSILNSKGIVTVNELAMQEYISERQINRIFNNWIGISPKKFIRIVRFQNVLSYAADNSYYDLSTIIFENGYYDQSHFLKDFRRLYGAGFSDFAEF